MNLNKIEELVVEKRRVKNLYNNLDVPFTARQNLNVRLCEIDKKIEEASNLNNNDIDWFLSKYK